MACLSVSDLADVLSYDPETGGLLWTKRVSNNVFAGMKAGVVNGQGYVVFQYRKVQLQAHRVAWALHCGNWPVAGIDHINGDRSDNRIKNLREANQSQNSANRRLQPNNKCGFKGVREKLGKWEAAIWDGKSVYLGRYDSPEAAHQAYVTEAKRLFGEFARGG